MVLDKTGTITRGTPSLTDVLTVDGHDEDELLRLVASAETETETEHPLATAIVTGARDRGLDLARVTTFDSVTGKACAPSSTGAKS